jgi:predicted DNA-binding transcriptional regulator YafY
MIIEFDYTDSTGRENRRTVEPLALNYRWYAWYLLAFCTYKNDYRVFKLNRMTDITINGTPITHEHGKIQNLLEKQWNSDSRRNIPIKLLCKAEARVPVMEYIKGRIIEEHENGDFVLQTSWVENERMGLSLLLGFGDSVEVLEPREIIEILKEKSKQIQTLYRN